MSKPNAPLVFKLTVDTVNALDREIERFRCVKAKLFIGKCTAKPYHDFYNDPNQ